MLDNFNRLDLAKIEEKVLEFWKKDKTFEKSLKNRLGRKTFVFYEGPPYANGRPGVHHILARIFKDIILRYKSMAGYYVPRKAGWDTHGLPIELETEKRLGIKSKKEIEEIGIDFFNQKAKESVFDYKDEWEKMTERIGYWLDLKDAYITCDNAYIERLWQVLKKIAQKGYFKKDYKVLPWCPRCQTSLSSHELGQPDVYQSVSDPSLYVKFPLKDEGKTYLLVWTTTPWTLPANVLVAVNPKLKYKKFKINDEFIWSYNTPPNANPESFEEELSGEQLIGKKYIPLYAENNDADSQKYSVVGADFISEEEGTTGFVHIAPAFGEDDLNLARKIGLSDFPTTISDSGKILNPHPGAGLFIKEGDSAIIEDLKRRGLIYYITSALHEYPHCWRCKTPLIYFARYSWFIEVSRLRQKLVKANKKINWIPSYIKEGRFGEWLKEAKDWAISRERYWGIPLPIWECRLCQERIFTGSLKELNDFSDFSGNRYFLLRHGQAESNKKRVISCWPEQFDNGLTIEGQLQVQKTFSYLKKRKIDLIFSSSLRRAKETAEIISEKLGILVDYDNRLTEYNVGVFNNRPLQEFHDFIGEDINKFSKIPENGETLSGIRIRMMSLIQELERKHKNKNILIIGHGEPLWVLEGAALGFTDEKIIESREKFIKCGEIREIKLLNLPYDNNKKLDLHRPYVDKLILRCPKCKGAMTRTPEVADVWFDSGAMPFGAGFYPKDFPADYICEGLDQTRGWFYTLLAVSVLLGEGSPFKNVICLGLILDKDGRKMSKSRGNVVEPRYLIDKYGVDALRWYFYTINDPADTKRFDELGLSKILREFLLIIYNVFSFYRLYVKEDLFTANGRPLANGQFMAEGQTNKKSNSSKNVLDRWILSRLNQTVSDVTVNLENYNVGGAAKKIEELVDDLSRWYLRRSRSRFQRPENKKDFVNASLTLKEILIVLSRLLAPFVPFFSDALYQSFCKDQSVHIGDWPKSDKKLIDKELVLLMDEIREIAGMALALRSDKGIKVRQPLASLKIKNQKSKIKNNKEVLKILAEEVNVKEIIFDDRINEPVGLDTDITPELYQEGIIREFIRSVQDLRKKVGLKPAEKVVIFTKGPPKIEEIISFNAEKLIDILSASSIEFRKGDYFDIESEIKIGEGILWFALKK